MVFMIEFYMSYPPKQILKFTTSNLQTTAQLQPRLSDRKTKVIYYKSLKL